jgi:N-acetylmuramoyl-L-alanine amidase/Putative peptidoglycan binding domain
MGLRAVGRLGVFPSWSARTKVTTICISSGHGKYIRGASGSPVPPQLDEVDEARKVVDRVAKMLNDGGVKTYKFHDNTSHDQNTNLNTIVNWHNSQPPHDLDISVHFNATPGAHGTEVWYVSQQSLAAAVSLAIAVAGGLTNRGAKKNGLFFLSNTVAPAILIEVCFCDSTSDSDHYRENFEGICLAIAETVAGKSLGASPPPDAERPPIPPVRPPAPADAMPRPTISKGDYGYNVREVQIALQAAPIDGDFGPGTAAAVEAYQVRKHLAVDGMVGPQTWAALDADFSLAPYPPELPPVFTASQLEAITDAASASAIAKYSWRDRGVAPPGYIKGIAVAYAQAVMRLRALDPIVLEMAKMADGSADFDALVWYEDQFRALGMDNNTSVDLTLRHLYVLLTGLGMRESSGQHCCGRDQSASNTTSDTAEAGLYQTSWNAHNACTDFDNLMDQYSVGSDVQGYVGIWSEGVECDSANWKSYGAEGDPGYDFQEMCKHVPTFAVESCAITLRNLRQHYGPINRKEAELRREADELFKEIEGLL